MFLKALSTQTFVEISRLRGLPVHTHTHSPQQDDQVNFACPSLSAKRWSAVSDGGENQGAEGVTVMGQKKAKNRHVSFGKSRLARAALFQRDS